MKIGWNIELLPFRVPNFVIQKTEPRPREEGFKEGPKYHLSDLSDEVLGQLCDKFREDVFAKARDTEGQTRDG